MKLAVFEILIKQLNRQWAVLSNCVRSYRKQFKTVEGNPDEILPHSHSYDVDELLECAAYARPLLEEICQNVVRHCGGRYSIQIKGRGRIEERLEQGIPLGDIEDP